MTWSSSRVGGLVFALWSREKLAKDSVVADNGSWGGATLAHCVRSPAEVDAIIDSARAAGANIGRAPADTSWGGYSAIFVDPDGHPWEIAHNPSGTLNQDGTITLPSF